MKRYTDTLNFRSSYTGTRTLDTQCLVVDLWFCTGVAFGTYCSPLSEQATRVFHLNNCGAKHHGFGSSRRRRNGRLQENSPSAVHTQIVAQLASGLHHTGKILPVAHTQVQNNNKFQVATHASVAKTVIPGSKKRVEEILVEFTAVPTIAQRPELFVGPAPRSPCLI